MDRCLKDVVTFMCVFLFATLEFYSVHGKTYNNDDHDDVYDCVDFYKQPAFDHPLLANHTFHHEMRPSSIPKLRMTSSRKNMNIQIFKRKNCPTGTVPIRREDRQQQQHFVKNDPGIHWAIVTTRWSPTKKYKGAAAEISTWNPSVQRYQSSSGRILMKSSGGLDSIQVGWTVNPELYDDNRTHLFIHTITASTRCFNLRCPGFVLVNKDFPIDALLESSVKGGTTWAAQYIIHKDPKDGHWWLGFGPNPDQFAGFWPQNIFTSLADSATTVEWGGQVFSQLGMPAPPMGSGSFLSGNAKDDAYCGFVTTMDENYQVADALKVDEYTDTPRYETKHEGNVGPDFGNLMYFGGPGGGID